jgi:hypothetical protein
VPIDSMTTSNDDLAEQSDPTITRCSSGCAGLETCGEAASQPGLLTVARVHHLAVDLRATIPFPSAATQQREATEPVLVQDAAPHALPLH